MRGLKRHISVGVLVERDREHRQAPSDQLGLLRLADPSGHQRDPAFQAALADQRAQGRQLVRVVGHAGDHDARVGRKMARCLGGEELALVRGDPARIEDVVLGLLPEEALRMSERRVKDRGLDAVERPQPVRNRLRVREDPLRLAQVEVVVTTDRVANRDAVRARREILPPRAPQVVGGPVVMDEPEALVRMAQDVAGRPDRNHHVRPAAHLEQANTERLVEDDVPTRAGRDVDGVNVVSAHPERLDQIAGDHPRPALHERDVGARDEDLHAGSDRAMRVAWSPLVIGLAPRAPSPAVGALRCTEPARRRVRGGTSRHARSPRSYRSGRRVSGTAADAPYA